MSWQVEKALDDLMAQETGAVQYPFGTRHAMAICYPNTYDVAMSNLGMQIIYREVNGREDWLCERAFLPDKDLMKVFEKTGEPLISLENRRPLSDFEILGLSVSFEMDYFNVPTILEMGRIPVLAADRDDDDTLVVMGGPVAFFNAEPLSPFVDVVLVGEGERFIHTFLDAYGEGKAQGLSRHDLLRYLATHVPGVYVPSLYRHEYDDDGHVVRIVPEEGIPAKVERQWHELTQPAETVIATPNTEFGAMYLIEIARGCGRHCRFCMAGYCYRRPRVRPLEYVKSAVLRGKALGKKIGLMGAAISDYPYIDELVTFIRDQGLRVLPWDEPARQWLARVRLLHQTWGDPWPDLSDTWLLDELENWLAPHLGTCTDLRQLSAARLADALRCLLPYPLLRRLEQLAPAQWQAPSGRSHPIVYDAEGGPFVAAKLQEFFGCEDTPHIADGRVPLTLHLLSPAGRPLQITRDLGHFWRNGYPQVRAEMRGRYPRHPWPDDPLAAQATARTNRQLARGK